MSAVVEFAIAALAGCAGGAAAAWQFCRRRVPVREAVEVPVVAEHRAGRRRVPPPSGLPDRDWLIDAKADVADRLGRERGWW